MLADPISTRLEIARRVATAYVDNPKVAAVLVAGSVARGLADELSDIELDVYWAEPPDDADRESGVEAAGWERVYAEEDEHEWSDGLTAEGVKVDVSGFTTATIDGYLEALVAADTEPELQVRATALLQGATVSGSDVIDAWRDRLRDYPSALAVAVVEQGLALRTRERLEMLAARDDVLMLHRDLVDGVQGLLDALFGVNRVYAPHPFHKWLTWEETLLPLRPDRLVERIRTLLVAAPADAAALLGGLVDDTLDLAAEHVPAADVATLRDDFDHRRVTG